MVIYNNVIFQKSNKKSIPPLTKFVYSIYSPISKLRIFYSRQDWNDLPLNYITLWNLESLLIIFSAWIKNATRFQLLESTMWWMFRGFLIWQCSSQNHLINIANISQNETSTIANMTISSHDLRNWRKNGLKLHQIIKIVNSIINHKWTKEITI